MKAEEAIATVAKISIIAVADCTVATRLHGRSGKKSNVAGQKQRLTAIVVVGPAKF